MWARSLGDWLTYPMLLFTSLGEESFFLLVMPLLLWNYDLRLGIQLGYILLSGSAVSSILKLVVASPRPYWISDRIHALRGEGTFGLPSGHSWTAAALWGRLALALESLWVRLGLIAVIILVGLSRIYLGVHFPVDVATGWLGGAMFLALFIVAERKLTPVMRERRPHVAIMALFSFSLLLITLGIAASSGSRSEPIPMGWQQRILDSDPSGPTDPHSLEPIVSASAALFGFGAGSRLLLGGRTYRNQGRTPQLVARYIVGVVGISVLYFGLGALIPSGDSPVLLMARFIRYGSVGFWVSFGGPRVFQHLRLA